MTTAQRLDLKLRLTQQLQRWVSVPRFDRFVVAAVLVGTLVRSVHLVQIDVRYPFINGGLFAEFAHQISANGWGIPERIPFYTPGGIPFAYPPGSFYLLGFITDVLHAPEFVAVNIQPVVVSVASLIAVVVLVYKLEFTRSERIFAIGAFAIMPRAYFDQVQAGGLAESLGTLALALLVIGLANFRKHPGGVAALWLGVAWALCVIASPGSALAAGIAPFAVAIAYILEGRVNIRQFVLWMTVSVAITVVLTAFYWLPVVTSHGTGVILSPLRSETLGASPTDAIIAFVKDFNDFEFLSVGRFFWWPVLVISGLVVAVDRKQWSLPLLLFSLALIPREGEWMAAIPSALLVGIAIPNLAVPVFKSMTGSARNSKVTSAVGYLLAFTLVGSAVIGPAWTNFRLLQVADRIGEINSVHLESASFIKAALPPNAKFVVISNQNFLEWFPRLTRREVLNMKYGHEWEPDEQIPWVVSCEDMKCVQESVTTTTGLNTFYVYADDDKIAPELVNSPEFEVIRLSSGSVIGIWTSEMDFDD